MMAGEEVAFSSSSQDLLSVDRSPATPDYFVGLETGTDAGWM
jgi:hypothetical protein